MKVAAGLCWLSVALALPASADVRVWSERDTKGEAREISRPVRDLRHLDFDDTISSLQADEPWLVCSEPLFRGDCQVVEGTVANLRLLGMNNRITSMRPAPPKAPVPAPSATKARPAPPPRAATPKRAAASPQAPVPPPKAAPPDRDVASPPAPVPAPRPKTSLPRPTEWWQGEGAPSVQGRERQRGGSSPRIEVFEKARQRGHRIQLEGPMADVTDLGYPVGSLVVKGGSWQVCSQPNFQGECRVVDGSSEKLANGMVVSSLRPTPN